MKKAKSPLSWIVVFIVLLTCFLFGFLPPRPPFNFKTISSGSIVKIANKDVAAIPLEETDLDIIKQILLRGKPKTVKAQKWTTIAVLRVYPESDFIIKIRFGQYNASFDVMKNYDVVYDAIVDNEDRTVLEDLIGRYVHNE